ncbi:MAG TPA: hypothetical protein VII56_03430 [Rhizomicrobium sp.]
MQEKDWIDRLISRIQSRYSAKDVAIIVLLAVCLAAAYFTAAHFDLPEANGALLTAVMISLCLTFYDRLGLLLPVQKQIATVSDRVERSVKGLEGYGAYRIARENFGFMRVVGQTVGGDSDQKLFAPDSIFPRLLTEAGPGTTIYYMNTFMEYSTLFTHALENCVLKGVNVNILLMDPRDCGSCENRWKDAYTDRALEKFTSELIVDAGRLLDIRNRANKHPKRTGKLTICFYKDSINYPLIAVCHTAPDGTDIPVVVYTGFYGARSSELMPYVEWRGGSFDVCEKFMEIVRNKWCANQNCTDLN